MTILADGISSDRPRGDFRVSSAVLEAGQLPASRAEWLIGEPGPARDVPIEQLSRLVSLAGASNFREFAKRWANRGGVTLDSVKRAGDSRNAYRTEPQTPRAALMRTAKLAEIDSGHTVEVIDKRSVLYRYQTPIDGLASKLVGLTILHLSDIHFEHGKDKPIAAIEQLSAHLRAKKTIPDIIVISGDVVTKCAEDFSENAAAALDSLPANLLRVFVLGNHDFYNAGAGDLCHQLVRRGFTDMSNRHLRLNIEGAYLNLFGVDDHLEGSPQAPIIEQAWERDTNLIVTHNLDALQSHYPRAVDLVLSGHTHAGEVNVGLFDGCDIMQRFGYLQRLNRQVRGWDTLSDRTLSYVSPGHRTHYFRFRTMNAGGTLLRLVPSTT